MTTKDFLLRTSRHMSLEHFTEECINDAGGRHFKSYVAIRLKARTSQLLYRCPKRSQSRKLCGKAEDRRKRSFLLFAVRVARYSTHDKQGCVHPFVHPRSTLHKNTTLSVTINEQVTINCFYSKIVY